MAELDLCLIIATQAHKGQKRRGGEDYVEHPKRVAETQSCPVMKCVALLHDVFEDTDETPESVREKGVSEEVIVWTLMMTKKKGQSYLGYVREIAKHPKLAKLKIADMFDNLCGSPSDRQKEKYREAMQILSLSV